MKHWTGQLDGGGLFVLERFSKTFSPACTDLLPAVTVGDARSSLQVILPGSGGQVLMPLNCLDLRGASVAIQYTRDPAWSSVAEHFGRLQAVTTGLAGSSKKALMSCLQSMPVKAKCWTAATLLMLESGGAASGWLKPIQQQ
ncbi:hypothetical protein Efla_007257 [Eimeria flavescens]